MMKIVYCELATLMPKYAWQKNAAICIEMLVNVKINSASEISIFNYKSKKFNI